jgi:hypothetical protein
MNSNGPAIKSDEHKKIAHCVILAKSQPVWEDVIWRSMVPAPCDLPTGGE